MPTRGEAIGTVIALALSPAAVSSAAILGPGGQVASQIKTHHEKKEEAPPAAPPAA